MTTSNDGAGDGANTKPTTDDGAGDGAGTKPTTTDDDELGWGRLTTMLGDAVKPIHERVEKIESLLTERGKTPRTTGSGSDGNGARHGNDGSGSGDSGGGGGGRRTEQPKRRLLDLLGPSGRR